MPDSVRVGNITKSDAIAIGAKVVWMQLGIRHDAAAVFLSVTSLDGNLARTLEPRASQPSGRLAASWAGNESVLLGRVSGLVGYADAISRVARAIE